MIPLPYICVKQSPSSYFALPSPAMLQYCLDVSRHIRQLAEEEDGQTTILDRKTVA